MKDTDQHRGWPIQLTGLFEQPPSRFSIPLSVVGVSLFIALIIVGFTAIAWLLIDLLSGDQKRASDAARAALPVLAGAVGLPLIVWRLLILDRQTKISEEKTQIDRETHYTSIFSRSIEQLGQTREMKRPRGSEEVSTETATTVPNIEVRLGGIHSLVRLAEESIRDRETIENTLLSYVRENSWSDRNGVTASVAPNQVESSWDWHSAYSAGKLTDEAIASLKEWTKSRNENLNARSSWAKALKETRVDVKEATTAIQKIRRTRITDDSSRFDECIFVDQRFPANALDLSVFDRCTFVRCTVDGTTRGRFLNSHFIDCTIKSLNNADLSFSTCYLDSVSFDGLTNSVVVMEACEIVDMWLSEMTGGTLDISLSNVLRLRVGNKTEVELNFKYASIAKATIRNLTAKPSSDFSYCSMADTALVAVDLSAVSNISEKMLSLVRATESTRHPTTMSRPENWPPLKPVAAA